MRVNLRLAAAFAAACIASSIGACGSGGGDTNARQAADTVAEATTATTAAAATGASTCGRDGAQPTTGDPIKVGAIVTKQPGTDFTDVTRGAQAYFDCVNANGGINGRPIQYIVTSSTASTSSAAASPPSAMARRTSRPSTWAPASARTAPRRRWSARAPRSWCW
jgi:branched-chain amino acid transport system substrate-binding protein